MVAHHHLMRVQGHGEGEGAGSEGAGLRACGDSIAHRVPSVLMFVLVVAVAVAASASAAVPYNQVVALNELFSSTSGKGWHFNDNWGVGDPCGNNWINLGCKNGVMCVACGTAVLPP